MQLYYEEVIFKGTTLKDSITNVATEMNSVRYLDKKSRHTNKLTHTLSPAHCPSYKQQCGVKAIIHQEVLPVLIRKS